MVHSLGQIKNKCVLGMVLKILDRVGTHIFVLIVFFQEKI